MKIIIEYEKCTGCGKCKEACPKGGKIWTIDRKRKIAIPSNLDFCMDVDFSIFCE